MFYSSLDGKTNGVSLARYQDPLHRYSKFLMTLPFDQNIVKWHTTEDILSRTSAKWEWYVEAQRLNAGLGTLQYLPAEVRCMIWKELFCCRDTLSSDGNWEYDCTYGSIFNLRAYYFGFGRHSLTDFDNFQGLRLVSSAVKSEADKVFLTCRTFRFNREQNMCGFFKQLTPMSSDQLLSIEIGICMLYLMETWMVPMMHLPSNLQEVRFRIYPVRFGYYDSERGKESLQHLGRLVQKAAEYVPNARITISSTNKIPLASDCQVVADDALELLLKRKEDGRRPSSGSPRPVASTESGRWNNNENIKLSSGSRL